jgi:HEAT repeat protein
VLGEISAHTKVPIFLSEALENERVSVVLEAVPLEEGLKRLLAAYDAFYLFSAAEKSSASIASIWVYPRGEGRELEPVPPTLWASTKELEAQLDNESPGVRSETYEALIERLGERGLATVLRGLVDQDEGVRLATLSTALNTGIEIPASDLHAVILGTQLQYVRVLALEALAGRPEAEAIAESVKDDPDEVIRNHARLMLEALRTRDRSKFEGRSWK